MHILDEDFVNGTGFFYKLWFICMTTTVVRFKYYFAWLTADAICNSSGLGFNGYDENGLAKWDLISNINVIEFEVNNVTHMVIVPHIFAQSSELA